MTVGVRRRPSGTLTRKVGWWWWTLSLGFQQDVGNKGDGCDVSDGPPGSWTYGSDDDRGVVRRSSGFPTG